jgi:hypothetical protein
MARGRHDTTKNVPLRVWAVCSVVLLAPSLLVWIVRGVAIGAHCAPGPELCLGIALGDMLRDALAIAWMVGADSLLLVSLALVAALAGVFARRPLLGAMTLLLLPLATLMLPMAAVYSANYPGCSVDENGIGDCALWGSKMGASFHAAANVFWQIYGFAPYTFALSLMLGLSGWFCLRPRGESRARIQ